MAIKEYYLSERLRNGQEYTFQAIGNVSGKSIDLYLGLDYYLGALVDGKLTFAINRITHDMTIKVDTKTSGATIEKVKLERGKKATGWTRAPEDLDEEFKSVRSEIEVSAEGIKSSVSDEISSAFSIVDQRVDSLRSVVNGKASSTRVYQLENSWSVRYLNSSGDMVSRINVNSKGVNIDGKNISLNGDTNVQGSFKVTGDMVSGGSITGTDIIARGYTRGIELSRYGQMSFKMDNSLAGTIFAEHSPEGKSTDLYIKTATRLRTNSIAATGDIRPDSDDWGNTNNDKLHLGNRGNRWHALMLGSGGIDESSDSRLKRDIKEIPLELVKYFEDVKPKTYTMQGKKQFGYIAQDVERALFKYTTEKYSLSVARENKEDFNIISKDESYLGLVYRQVTAIKDAEKDMKIKELEDRVGALEAGVRGGNIK